MFNQHTNNQEEELSLDFEQFDINEKIEIATQTLNRNIDFVKNFDNKASFVLAIVSATLTIVFSNDKIVNLITLLLQELSIRRNDIFNTQILLYLLFIFIFLLVTILGIFYLISVFYAQVKGSNRKSLIFFRGICNHKDYLQSFKTVKKHELLEDLIDQINVNAHIADKKYKRFKYGLVCSITGLFLFLVLVIIGLFSIG